jgi:ribosomal protein S19
VKVASVEVREETFEEDGIHITFKYGEFAPFLKQVNHYLSEAKKHSANEIQDKMIGEYIDHFHGGHMDKHI